MTRGNRHRYVIPAILLSTLVALPQLAAAQQFAAVVSPPRLEFAAKPGERSRQVVEITNASMQPATYHVKTADWTLADDGGVSFSDELAQDSCRPWVAIERRDIEVPAGGRYRFRFDVETPADTPARECRFGLMVEGDPTPVQSPGGLVIPVSGRIGVIVYVAVGDIAPDLAIAPAGIVDVNGNPMPAVTVQNTGTAHGRLDGFLSGTDAKGRDLDFTPSTLPILPGETRTMAFAATDGLAPVTTIAYPVRIKGTIEWGDGKRTEFDQLYSR